MTALLLTALALGGAVADGGAVVEDPDAPTVGASIDRAEGNVGDRLTLTVSAVAKAGIPITLPGKLDLGKLEILDRDDGDRGGRDLGDGRRSHRFVLGVAAYEPGAHEVPPIELSYLSPRGEVRAVRTGPLSVTIRALVTDDVLKPEAQPIRAPRPALIEDKRILSALKYAGGFVALLVLALILRRVFRRRRHAEAQAVGPSAPRRPPDEVAMERLAQLRAAGQFSVDNYRPVYFAVAEVVRAYLGARYGFDSLELTTTELLGQLQLKAPHLCEPGNEVESFLIETDLVKFAKTGSTDAAVLKTLDTAQAIVLSTARPLEQAAAALSGQVRPPQEAA
jgi:hypothetical protein